MHHCTVLYLPMAILALVNSRALTSGKSANRPMKILPSALAAPRMEIKRAACCGDWPLETAN